MRGDCYAELKNLEAAMENYKLVRLIDPQENRGHAHLTEALFNAGKYEQLIKGENMYLVAKLSYWK